MSLSKELRVFMKLSISDKKKFSEYLEEVDRNAYLNNKARENGGIYIHALESGTQITNFASTQPRKDERSSE